MSPTLLVQDGFKFFFYANEHLPRHIHVVRGDDYATIDLTSLTVRECHMKRSDLKAAMVIVTANRELFERKWDEFFKR